MSRINKHEMMRICSVCYTSFYYYHGNNGMCRRCRHNERSGVFDGS